MLLSLMKWFMENVTYSHFYIIMMTISTKNMTPESYSARFTTGFITDSMAPASIK